MSTVESDAIAGVTIGGDPVQEITVDGDVVWRRIIDEGLVSRWTFDEGSGTTAYDPYGSNHGTINGATYTTDSVVGDYALKFGGGGSGDYVDVGTGWYETGSATRTAMAWYKVNTTTAPNRAGVWNFGSDGGQELEDYSATLLRGDGTDWWRAQFWATDRDYEATNSYNGEWHHVAYSYDGSTVRIYHDGTQVATLNATLVTGNDVGYIGDWQGGNYWGGKIDDVRYYNREVSASEIADIANLVG